MIMLYLMYMSIFMNFRYLLFYQQFLIVIILISIRLLPLEALRNGMTIWKKGMGILHVT